MVAGAGLAFAVGGCGSSGHASSGGAGGSRPSSSGGAAGASGGSGGNGEASKSAKQILADAATALRDANGYVLRAAMIQNGRHVLMRVASAGAGDVEVGFATGNANAEMIGSPTGYFIRANAPFWAAHASARASVLANHWIQVPPADAQGFTSTLGHFAPATLARCLGEGHGTLSVVGRTTIAGRPAIVIKDAGNAPGSSPGTLAVAASGPPYPLQAVNSGRQRPGGRIDVCNDGKATDTHGVLTLSDFGAVPPIQTPKNPIRTGQTAVT